MTDVVLELDQREVAALLLLLKLGIDIYTVSPADGAVLEALSRTPNPVIDSVIAKVSRAGTEATKRDG